MYSLYNVTACFISLCFYTCLEMTSIFERVFTNVVIGDLNNLATQLPIEAYAHAGERERERA